ncbi:MAG: PD-(D/E)XK nuclease-like domain-containing protein [Chitinophagales bacterium]|nr:PD-(D/E)XK nuclease-like domain-containing protein [Chitinophagales bacterium]
MIKHSKDGRVAFCPNTHTYTLDGERRLTGVTTLISQFVEPFDSFTQAVRYAEKYGLNAQEVMEEWDKKGKDSRDDGTLVHEILETFILKGIIINNGAKKSHGAIKFIKDLFLTKRLIPVEAEYIVYNDFYASMIDCIVKDKDGNHYILDWKTNKEIKTSSFQGKKMLEPLNDLYDCNYYHYSLQVAIYKELCKEFTFKNCYIVHINETDYRFIKAKPIVLPDNFLNQQYARDN